MFRFVIRIHFMAGFWFTTPLTVEADISLRVMNFNSEKLKGTQPVVNYCSMT